MHIDSRYVWQEPDYGEAALPDSVDFILDVNGDRMLGVLYLPSGIYDEPHPGVVLCHGIPGTNSNDDLAQGLRRMGCVVIRLYHRGAWGSGGTYSFSHCIEDAVAAIHWLETQGAKTYGVDPNALFLIGHSAGGSTVYNASQQLPELKGTILFCPLDHIALHRYLPEAELRQVFLGFSRVLHITSFEELWQDSLQHMEQWSYIRGASYFQHRNLLLIGGSLDTVTPEEVILKPFWKEILSRPTKADHTYITLHSNHSLDTARLALAQSIGDWIEKVVPSIETRN